MPCSLPTDSEVSDYSDEERQMGNDNYIEELEERFRDDMSDGFVEDFYEEDFRPEPEGRDLATRMIEEMISLDRRFDLATGNLRPAPRRRAPTRPDDRTGEIGAMIEEAQRQFNQRAAEQESSGTQTDGNGSSRRPRGLMGHYEDPSPSTHRCTMPPPFPQPVPPLPPRNQEEGGERRRREENSRSASGYYFGPRPFGTGHGMGQVRTHPITPEERERMHEQAVQEAAELAAPFLAIARGEQPTVAPPEHLPSRFRYIMQRQPGARQEDRVPEDPPLD